MSYKNPVEKSGGKTEEKFNIRVKLACRNKYIISWIHYTLVQGWSEIHVTTQTRGNDLVPLHTGLYLKSIAWYLFSENEDQLIFYK